MTQTVRTRVIASSSSGPAYLKGIRCLGISEKYSLASWDVLVPKPGWVTTTKRDSKWDKALKWHKTITLTVSWHEGMLTCHFLLPHRGLWTNLCSIWFSKTCGWAGCPSMHWTQGCCRKTAEFFCAMPTTKEINSSFFWWLSPFSN